MVVIPLSRFLLLAGKVMEKLSLILLKEYVSICKLIVFLQSNVATTASFAVCFSVTANRGRLLFEGGIYLFCWEAHG